ncbi:hypothetical protein V492_00433 [Pseudogymnoascus sp. VKM F-4246]|nr:hypothetical protein V492_00433 [Pseudogymnoascus sp. VKM F-4246]
MDGRRNNEVMDKGAGTDIVYLVIFLDRQMFVEKEEMRQSEVEAVPTEALLSPSPLGFLFALIVVISIPILLHGFLSRGSGVAAPPSILLVGPSGSGKTSLQTLFERGKSAPTHTSQTPLVAECSLPAGVTAASAKYRSVNDPSHRVREKFLLLDTPGHGKLRHHAFNAVGNTKNLKGIIFVVDAANLPAGDEGLRQAAEYLHDTLLLLQKRLTATTSSKDPKGIEVLIAANKMDLFTAQPSAIVRSLLEKEIGKVRNSKSKGLLESGIETAGELDDVDSDDWLGETGSTQFKFEQLEEFNISTEVAGGCALGESEADVQKWWNAATLKELLETTSELLGLLEEKCRRKDAVFDEKLADYVFFPLSHVLRACQKRPGRLAEAATKCVQILLQYGWTNNIGIELGQQLLILFTLFAGGGASSDPMPEELKLESFKALALLFDDLRRTPKGANSIVEVSVIPALGQCLSTILDGVTEGPSSDIQIEALEALKALWGCIKDRDALSTFLPGTVSALTKCLMPNNKNPRSVKVLVISLQVLQSVLTTSIGDIHVRRLPDDTDVASGSKPTTTLSKSWLTATSAQVKLALTNISKLRSHKSEEVRRELERTCLILLDECNTSLKDAAALLVETSMIVAAPQEDSQLSQVTGLKDLAIMYPSIGELINSTVYNWETSLPRIIQSSDDSVKASAIHQLSQARALLGAVDAESKVLDNSITESLRDSVINMLDSSKPEVAIEVVPVGNDKSGTLPVTVQNTYTEKYPPLVLEHESQVETRNQLNKLVDNVGPREVQLKMTSKLLEQMFDASGNSLLASFWLSFQLIKSVASKTEDFDDFLTSDVTSSEEQEVAREELYNFAVSILSESENSGNDWRLLAVGLEVVAYSSQQAGDEFRANLVDTLYSVVQLLGSDNSHLRSHAITSLNIIAKSCGYSQTSELIVDNVDYLVNAVSLKLNTFNISPQVPQVLVMMIRLTGPTLLPYLDDVVGSIFAALDNFHGYSKLVDSLFSVLGEIVQEGAGSGQLQLTSETAIDHQKRKPEPPNFNDVLEMFRNMKLKSIAVETEHEDFPKAPWKSAKELLDEAEAPGEEEEGEEPQGNKEVAKSPPTKVYTMVESIARLSQHYLTSGSPFLRLRLLDLISTATRALHSDENAFLPLVNDIWPVVVKRLYDPEPFVVIGAANAVSKIFEAAGNFMSTRVQTEWPDLIKLVRQWMKKADGERRGKHGRGRHTLSWQVWEAMVGLVVAILKYVRINDGVFDDALSVLSGRLEREDVREALETINAEAVWLVDLAQGRITKRDVPVMEGYEFASWETL